MPFSFSRSLLIALLLLSATPALAYAGDAGLPEACAGRGTAVLVRTEEHKLYACEKNQTKQAYGIRLGRKGVGKKSARDGKTPLGSYAIGLPRRSKDYGTFIPIGYPTEEQKRRGYTGSGVGIHGPIRQLKWLGSPVNWFDTSAGCVGLATDEEMNALADWVRDQRPRMIVIE